MRAQATHPQVHQRLWGDAEGDVGVRAKPRADRRIGHRFDQQVETFDRVYAGKRPRYLEGYEKLKAAIKPWGSA